MNLTTTPIAIAALGLMTAVAGAQTRNGERGERGGSLGEIGTHGRLICDWRIEEKERQGAPPPTRAEPCSAAAWRRSPFLYWSLLAHF